MVGGLRCRCHRSVWAEDWQCAPSAVPAHEAAEGAAAAAAVPVSSAYSESMMENSSAALPVVERRPVSIESARERKTQRSYVCSVSRNKSCMTTMAVLPAW